MPAKQETKAEYEDTDQARNDNLDRQLVQIKQFAEELAVAIREPAKRPFAKDTITAAEKYRDIAIALTVVKEEPLPASGESKGSETGAQESVQAIAVAAPELPTEKER